MARFPAPSLVCLTLAALAYTQSPPVGTTIHPVTHLGKCLDVRGAVFANGTPVQVYDCNGTNAQKWTFVRNQPHVQIRVKGTNFCLDAGPDRQVANGIKLKIWECYDSLGQQQWLVGDNGIIKLSGRPRETPSIRRPGQPYIIYSDICLDLTDGRLDNTSVVQVWDCFVDNMNQFWSYGTTPAPPQCPIPVCTTCPPGETSTIVTPENGCPTCTCLPCPTPVCGTCPAGTASTILVPDDGCPTCACVPSVACPSHSCAACPAGATPTFTTPAGGDCPQCACAAPAPTPA